MEDEKLQKEGLNAILSGDVGVLYASTSTFGKMNGEEITNKKELLAEIDKILHEGEGAPKPPDLELIFCEPYSMANWGKVGLCTNPYGHVACRYTRPDGISTVLNIVGFGEAEMVNFVEPADYFFGTNDWDKGNEQGGIYNRNFVSCRIENVPKEKLEKLHAFYEGLQKSWKEKKVEYSMVASAFKNWWTGKGTSGNCSYWTGHGLKEAGIIDHSSMWPKELWLRLYNKYHRQEKSNLLGYNIMHIVTYKRILGCNSYGVDVDPTSWVKPLSWYSSYKYEDLDCLADVVIQVPPGKKTAEIQTKVSAARKKKGSSKIQLFHRKKLDRCTSLFCTRFWIPLPTIKSHAASTPAEMMMSSLTPQMIEFKQVSMGPHTLWGLDAEKNLYHWDGKSFVEFNYAYELVMEASGEGAVISLEGKESENKGENEKENKSDDDDDSDEEIFDIDNNSVIYVTVDKFGKAYGVLESGKVICLDKDNTKSDALDAAPNDLKKLYILDDSNMWAIDNEGKAHLCKDSTWQTIGGALRFNELSAAVDGTVWGIDTNGVIQRWVVSSPDEPWEEVVYNIGDRDDGRPERFTSVAVASAEDIWCVDSKGMVYVWEEEEHVFSSLRNVDEGDRYKISVVAVNTRGKACGISTKGEIFVLSRHRLQIITASSYTKIWDDWNTGCKPYDVGFWRPMASAKQQKRKEPFKIIGDLAERSHAEDPIGVGILVRERFDRPSSDDPKNSKFPLPEVPLLLAPAVDFECIWTDEKTGGKFGDVTIWKPIPPAGYVVLGDIAAKGHNKKPDPVTVHCVHESIVKKAVIVNEDCLWQSKKSSALTHVTLWMLKDPQGGAGDGGILLPTFTAHKARKGKLFWHFDPPTYDVYCLDV